MADRENLGDFIISVFACHDRLLTKSIKYQYVKLKTFLFLGHSKVNESF